MKSLPGLGIAGLLACVAGLHAAGEDVAAGRLEYASAAVDNPLKGP